METVATIPGLSEPFSLKGWDVTALGIAQGNRVEAAPMRFCCLSALKGRHGPSRPFRAERRKRTAVGRLTTQGVALGCYVPALRAERMKTSRDWSLVGPVVLLQSRSLVDILRCRRRAGPGPLGHKFHVPGTQGRATLGLPHLPAHFRQPTGDEGRKPVQDCYADGQLAGDMPKALCGDTA